MVIIVAVPIGIVLKKGKVSVLPVLASIVKNILVINKIEQLHIKIVNLCIKLELILKKIMFKKIPLIFKTR